MDHQPFHQQYCNPSGMKLAALESSTERGLLGVLCHDSATQSNVLFAKGAPDMCLDSLEVATWRKSTKNCRRSKRASAERTAVCGYSSVRCAGHNGGARAHAHALAVAAVQAQVRQLVADLKLAKKLQEEEDEDLPPHPRLGTNGDHNGDVPLLKGMVFFAFWFGFFSCSCPCFFSSSLGCFAAVFVFALNLS